jgi:hypothetical protein
MEFSFIFRNGLVNYAQGKPEDVARLAVIMHVTPNGVILEVEVEDGGIGVGNGSTTFSFSIADGSSNSSIMGAWEPEYEHMIAKLVVAPSIIW